MEREVFVCPDCGAIQVVEQTPGMSLAEYSNRLPPQIPCDTKDCEGYAKPESEVRG